MNIPLAAEEFLKSIPTRLLIDARSEAEFEQGHIPGAFNVPLLNNEERKQVGTIYKQAGRAKAVEKGFDLVGPRFGDMIREVAKHAKTKEVAVYCWRGGMRSGILCWILSLYGFKTYVLEGGYKAYRRLALTALDQTIDMVVIGGKTGSGKTLLLKKMEELGEQVIDLEELAHHKGSAFGMMGMPAQPTNEQFENKLFAKLQTLDKSRKVWIENESRMIGKIKIPDHLFDQIRSAPIIETELVYEKRVERIANEYCKFPVDQLIENTKRLERKLGNKGMREAITFLEQKDFVKWIALMLEYYDKTYGYGIALRNRNVMRKLIISHDDYIENAKQVINTFEQENLKSSVKI